MLLTRMRLAVPIALFHRVDGGALSTPRWTSRSLDEDLDAHGHRSRCLRGGSRRDPGGRRPLRARIWEPVRIGPRWVRFRSRTDAVGRGRGPGGAWCGSVGSNERDAPGTSPWVDKIGRTSMGDPMGTKGEDPIERERLKGRRGCLPGSERAS